MEPTSATQFWSRCCANCAFGCLGNFERKSDSELFANDFRICTSPAIMPGTVQRAFDERACPAFLLAPAPQDGYTTGELSDIHSLIPPFQTMDYSSINEMDMELKTQGGKTVYPDMVRNDRMGRKLLFATLLYELGLEKALAQRLIDDANHLYCFTRDADMTEADRNQQAIAQLLESTWLEYGPIRPTVCAVLQTDATMTVNGATSNVDAYPLMSTCHIQSANTFLLCSYRKDISLLHQWTDTTYGRFMAPAILLPSDHASLMYLLRAASGNNSHSVILRGKLEKYIELEVTPGHGSLLYASHQKDMSWEDSLGIVP